MVRRRSLTSMSGAAVTGLRCMISATLSSPSAPPRPASARSSSWKVSMPTIRPCSSTTSEPRFSFAMVVTASAARPAGSMLSSRLPLTRRISFTCMASSPRAGPRGSLVQTPPLRNAPADTIFAVEKVALVTGGAQGIGRAIALLLAGHGYKVAVADIEKSDFFYVRTDVSREPSVRACVRAVVKRFGRLDALVNNAGLTGPDDGPVEKVSLARWNRRIGVNLTGPFLMAKHAAPHLRRARGAIVNVASTRALQSEPDTEAYAASKGGLVALTHALALSAGPEVRVNCISPGWISQRPVRKKDHAQHPVGRVGAGQDVAELVAYLLSDAAGFVTGQNFVIDGGMTKKMIYV